MTLTIHHIERQIEWRIAELGRCSRGLPYSTSQRQDELRRLLAWIEGQVDKAAREEE